MAEYKMKKMFPGKQAEMTQQECIDLMKGKVAQYRYAGKQIYLTGVYRRGRNYKPIDRGHASYCDVYYCSEDKEIINLCYNTAPHRAKTLIKALKDGSIHQVPYSIISNYATNGHNTKIGLFRSLQKIKRIEQIARSHADYLGSESGNSGYDHKKRVEMRRCE